MSALKIAGNVLEQIMMGAAPQATIQAAIELAYMAAYADAVKAIFAQRDSALQKHVDAARAERNASRRPN